MIFHYIRRTVCLLFIIGISFHTAFAQPGCPNITCGPNQIVDCNVNCANLTATVLETGATTTYTVSSTPYAPPAPFTGGTAQFINTDDIWGDIITLPFNFCFYGTSYNQLVIGANGLLTFDLTQANQYCAWEYTATCPTTTPPGAPNYGLYTNSIMGAYHDIDPSVCTGLFNPVCPADINYIIGGSAPCRTFTVNFTTVPLYSCNNLETTQQIVLYETTNIIEVYLQNKPACASWNSGNSTVGIQDATGANGITPPGRNTGNWSASNEAWRFTPSGAPNYVVNWYDGGNLVGTGLTLNVCPSATTTYDAEVVYTNCDGAVVTVTDQVTVTQNSTVSVNVNPTIANICSGQSVSATASSPNAGIVYSWSPATGLSTTSGPTVTASPTTTTLYTVTGDDGNCAASANVNVVVVDIQLQTSSTDASCAGDDGTATVTPSGGVAPYAYSWSTVPAQNTQTATGLAAGNYDVTVTDATGCSQTTTVTVSLTLGSLSPPTMTSTDAVCTSANGTATATPIDGIAPYTYSWNTNPVQTTQTATGLTAGTYTATITDNGGCSASNTVIVGIDPGNLSVAISSFADALCNGSCDGTATALAQNGTAPFQYAWDDPTFQQTSVATGLCANTYNVGVADANGCLATAQVVITEPTPIVANAVMDNQSNCGNPDGGASVVASGGTVAVDYTYTWNSVPPQITATAVGLLPGNYTVSVTDDNGCSEIANVVVTSTPGFTASITSSTDVSCFLGCDGNATVQESGTAVLPVTYSWNTVPVQQSATATNLCAGSYTATITDNVGCIATASVTIAEPTKVTANAINSSNLICIGESSDLTASAFGGTPPYLNFGWTSNPNDPTLNATQQNQTVSPLVTTTYTLIAIDANGCTTAPVTTTVQVRDPLTLSVTRPIFSPDTGICPYDFAVIDLQAFGGDGDYRYFLAPDNLNPVVLPMQVQPNTTTTYNFNVLDGCTTPPAFASSTITVFVIPTVDFIGDDLSGCDVHTVQFSDETTPNPVLWNWSFGDPNSSANTSTAENPVHEFSGPGLYSISLHVKSAEGCISDSTKNSYVEVFPLPIARFDLNPEKTNVLDGTIQFTDQSIGDIAAWSWNFGDGEISDIQNPEHNYQDTGTFTVWLLVTTVDGCEDETTRQVEIEPDFMFYVPNAFSPNRDGKNDLFRGYGEGVDWNTYQMSIFNRWGEELYFTSNIDEPWNGWFKNQEVPNDVYVYTIRIFDLKGNEHNYWGHVTLYR
ncbi:MAG: gliding motility-associated C-terminal domain-containing protein [Flavobacteriales bacterium]|nr:gliding motility-associated C-terminal domain-containing protein [Flavobacteriales bacterium]